MGIPDSEIIITDVFQALEMVKLMPNTYRVVSISNSRNSSLSLLRPYLQVHMEKAKEVLYLEFDDVNEDVKSLVDSSHLDVKYATEEDCIQALNFLERGEPCIVHCRAGVSRSPAIVLGHLLTKYPTYQAAVDRLLEIRPSSIPNSYVVRLMCRILGRENEYRDILSYLEDKRYNNIRSHMAPLRNPFTSSYYENGPEQK